MNQVAKQQRGLGRGLSSLMGEGLAVAEPSSAVPSVNEGGEAVIQLGIAQLQGGKYQPRTHFDEEALSELADSIEKHGIMQPIVARALEGGRYEIIAGERRWRAAQLAKFTQVPVIVRTVSDAQALELALIENIQRMDLNPLEEAAGYQRLMDEFGYTQEVLAQIVGKSRSHVANLLRLQKLPESIKKRIDSGALTMGHARAILMAKNPEELAQRIMDVGLSVRQAEEWAKHTIVLEKTPVKEPVSRENVAAPARTRPAKNEDVIQLENMLAEALGLRVSIDARGPQAGEVVIGYDSLTQLDEILRRLGGGV